jgi:hypothetical protein
MAGLMGPVSDCGSRHLSYRNQGVLVIADTALADGAMGRWGDGCISHCAVTHKLAKGSVFLVALHALAIPAQFGEVGAGPARRSQGIGLYAWRLYTQSLPAQRECDRTAP